MAGEKCVGLVVAGDELKNRAKAFSRGSGQEAHPDQQTVKPTWGHCWAVIIYFALTYPDMRGLGAQLPCAAHRKGFTLALVTLKGSSSDSRSFTTTSSTGLSVPGALLPRVPAPLACLYRP